MSNKLKMDYPLESLSQVFASIPDSQFVLLGTDKEAARAATLATGNVKNRRVCR